MGTELDEALKTIQTVSEEAEKKPKKKTKKKEEKEVEIDILKNEADSTLNAIENLSQALSVDSIFGDASEGEPRDAYTTDVLNRIKEIESFMSIDEINAMLRYVKGGERPTFMDTMMTHTNEKLTESIKLMSIIQLLRLPALFDYQNTLSTALMSKETIEKLSPEDMAKVSANIQKEIADTLNSSIRVASQLPTTNAIPTKVEKLANALLYVSEGTRERIEEIIRAEGQ